MKGKVKELFEEWYDHLYYPSLCMYDSHDSGSTYTHIDISDLPPSMQWGVLQDFYDSKGFYISQKAEGYKPIWYDYIIKHGLEVEFSRHFKTRPEARKAALQKAEELLEEKL